MKWKLPLIVSSSFLLSTFLYAANNINQTDLDLLGKLAQGNTSEVQTGEFVKSKASSKSVKQFASRMIEDHSNMKNSLSNWAAKNSITLPKGPNNSKDEGRSTRRKFWSGIIEAVLRLSSPFQTVHFTVDG